MPAVALFGDIGRDLIAMTLLQQENRVIRAAEKQARIRGRITRLSGIAATVEGVAPCLV
jgi:hypothetical protein